MNTQMIVLYVRNLISALPLGKKIRGQGLTEYLGLLVGLGVVIVIVVAIIAAKLYSKANSSSW
jgi:multisubunit Na+/H+ antiporter MnhB subunit